MSLGVTEDSIASQSMKQPIDIFSTWPVLVEFHPANDLLCLKKEPY